MSAFTSSHPRAGKRDISSKGGPSLAGWRTYYAAKPRLALTLLFGGILILTVTVRGLLTSNDFFTMFGSSAMFAQGQSAYGPIPAQADTVGLNLNHPMVVLMVAPFTLLPRAVAFLVFTVLSGAALACTAVLLMRELGLQGINRWVLATAVITFPGVAYCIGSGQLGVFLALIVTAVWLCIRQRRWLLAGALIGVLSVLKPFFLPLLGVLLIRRQIAGVLAAIAGAAGVSLAALPFVGMGTFREWFHVLASISWFDHPLNVSMAGLLHRLTGNAFTHAELTAITIAVVLTASMVVAFVPPPPWISRRDRDFALLLCAALLGSPLGWLYYLPALAPALAVVAVGWPHYTSRARTLLGVGVALLWLPHGVPMLLPATPLWTLLAGAHTYATVGLLAVLAGIVPLTARSVGRDAGVDLTRVGVDAAVQ